MVVYFINTIIKYIHSTWRLIFIFRNNFRRQFSNLMSTQRNNSPNNSAVVGQNALSIEIYSAGIWLSCDIISVVIPRNINTLIPMMTAGVLTNTSYLHRKSTLLLLFALFGKGIFNVIFLAINFSF